MKPLLPKEYAETIRARKKRSRVYTAHQFVGLQLSKFLDDAANKKLYIRLAKEYDAQALLGLAKDVGRRRNVRNLGAYFMRMFELERKGGKIKKSPLPKKKKQMKLKLRKRVR